MPPKKGGKGKKDEPVENEVTILQKKVVERDEEIKNLDDKVAVLEEKSQNLEKVVQKVRSDSKENEDRLHDITDYLSREVEGKHVKCTELEEAFASLKDERSGALSALEKELVELKRVYKYAIDDIMLKLDSAQVELREINEFTMRKAALEKEISELNEQLEKEKKDHQESISDVERASLQDRERLKKEMAVKIEETRQAMLQQIQDQIRAKTKKTNVENEHLVRELGFHIKQTEALLHRNEKLVVENIDFHRHILLAKELEDDLRRRNLLYQKTMRVLVFKLREKHLASKLERKMEEDELKQLIGRNEALKVDVQEEKQQLEKLREVIDAKTKAAECTGPAEEAMKFLYACLEDLEVDRLLKVRADRCVSRCGIEDISPILPSSLDQSTVQQRKGFLKHLIRTAVSLRAGNRKPEQHSASNTRLKGKSSPMINVEDILALPMEAMQLDDPVIGTFWVEPISAGTQTDMEPPDQLLQV